MWHSPSSTLFPDMWGPIFRQASLFVFILRSTILPPFSPHPVHTPSHRRRWLLYGDTPLPPPLPAQTLFVYHSHFHTVNLPLLFNFTEKWKEKWLQSEITQTWYVWSGEDQDVGFPRFYTFWICSLANKTKRSTVLAGSHGDWFRKWVLL